jgi:hypothetical protein
MKTHIKIFAVACILISSFAFASETEYTYFNFSNCTQGWIASSSFPNDKDYVSLKNQAEEWNKNPTNGYMPAHVFQAGDDKSFGIVLSVISKSNTQGTYNRVIDALNFQKPSVNNFPLAGATYELIKDQETLPSFICIKGCTATMPRIIHNLGYESPEDWRNIEYEKNLKVFETKCGPRK